MLSLLLLLIIIVMVVAKITVSRQNDVPNLILKVVVECVLNLAGARGFGGKV